MNNKFNLCIKNIIPLLAQANNKKNAYTHTQKI